MIFIDPCGLTRDARLGQKLTALGLSMALLGGCATSTPDQQRIDTPRGPSPTRGVTPIDAALRCLADNYPPNVDLRMAVNDLTDGTGSTTADNALSKVLTQRPDVMMTIGLSKTGVPLVNRSSTGVAEWELRQSMQKYIGDARPNVGPGTGQQQSYRQVLAGSMLGSTHYISGALTELNWNIHSDVNEVGVGGLTLGGRSYRISIAADLIVTNSRSTEIVMAKSYSKQLVGRETSVGLFRFFDVGRPSKNFGTNEVFELNIGRHANEPVQTAVRWMLETAAYDIVSELTGSGFACDELVPEDSRPLRVPRSRLASNGTVRPDVTSKAMPFIVAMGPRALDKPASQPVQAPAAPAPAMAGSVPTVTEQRSLDDSGSSESNRLTGVNLFDDEGVSVLRIDTLRPLEKLPTAQVSKTGKLLLVFDGISNGIGKLPSLHGNGVREAGIYTVGDSVQVELELEGRFTHKFIRQKRSLLVQLIPINGTAQQILDAVQPTGVAENEGALNTGGIATISLELVPKGSSTPSREEVLRIIQP